MMAGSVFLFLFLRSRPACWQIFKPRQKRSFERGAPGSNMVRRSSRHNVAGDGCGAACRAPRHEFEAVYAVDEVEALREFSGFARVERAAVQGDIGLRIGLAADVDGPL